MNQPSPLPISCFIITKNEERKIAEVIKSVIFWVDEVLVIDSGSTDRTIEICKELDVKVINKKWIGFGAQKRYGEDLCKNNWVLNLDGDEVISTPLKKEIISLFKSNKINNFVFYSVWRQNVFPFGPNKHSMSGDRVVRLYKKSEGRYANHPTWDKVNVPSEYKVKKLEGFILHYWMKDFEQQVSKLNSYTTALARNTPQKSILILTIRLFFGFPFDFLKAYIIRHHWRHGKYGFAVAVLYAFSRFMRIIKMMEIKYKDK